ncbi:MAG: UDP-2,3-diacylglucosamine diphosphatase [Bacteroidetes bacterium]|nr:UDP-2,3-diacylglucosamine diphosphatase [Bacteroidota bacterium]
MNKKIYFASDFHLGIPDHQQSLEREKKLVAWLEMARQDAAEIYLMGDLFDFWFEYKHTVPKGYTRLLGKLAEITDPGSRIPVHLFRGNHDMWAFSYLQEEIGIQLHRDPEFKTFYGRNFYLAHGDGLGPGDHGYKFIKKVFANPVNQWLFRLIHPDLGISMALFWSRKSRHSALQKEKTEEERNLRLINERIRFHSEELVKEHPDLDFLIYGHYHYPVETTLSNKSVQVVLGDWLTHFTYAVFDGEKLALKEFRV